MQGKGDGKLMATAKKKTPAKRGPKTKFDMSKIVKAEKVARAGGRNIEIAKALGITPSTLAEWNKKYPELSDTLKASKEDVDKTVECALLRNALGYSVTETKRAYRPLFKPNGEPLLDNQGHQIKALLREEVTVKDIAPNTTAQIFWLKNRQPAKWRMSDAEDWDKAKIEINEMFDLMRKEAAERAATAAR